MNENDRNLLKDELKLMEDAVAMLKYSFQKCEKFKVRKKMSDDELESFEALCSRFARTSDIFIQKLLRLVDKLDLEKPGTVRDRINRAEKKGIIENADTLIDIRNLRNDIAHEYMPDTLLDIYNSVLFYVPKLIKSFENLKEYTKRYF